ncbi:unnamed protein product [Caenorhabditis auriculariae]|uniref:Methyltransferase domain-containing protein n=1 Tax=Caenorhabditis auriculariae TaxID=2777116 RepID=A0A8S1GVX3_9PELO|nr:unnamed protein product [Caenorhabditis auriculariae]
MKMSPFTLALYVSAGLFTLYVLLKGSRRISLDAHTRQLTSYLAPSLSIPSQRVINLFEAQAPQRQNNFKKLVRGVGGYFSLYNNVVPEVFCPELVRVGTTHDGGKWMCNPFSLPKSCTILSLGLHNEISFERQLQSLTDNTCSILGYDMIRQRQSIQQQMAQINGKIKKTKIVKHSQPENNEFTIEDLLKQEDTTEVEILKIDIEGTEFDVLLDFLDKFQVAQILMEVHNGPTKMARLLTQLSARGYWLLSYEINGKFHQDPSEGEESASVEKEETGNSEEAEDKTQQNEER